MSVLKSRVFFVLFLGAAETTYRFPPATDRSSKPHKIALRYVAVTGRVCSYSSKIERAFVVEAIALSLFLNWSWLIDLAYLAGP